MKDNTINNKEKWRVMKHKKETDFENRSVCVNCDFLGC